MPPSSSPIPTKAAPPLRGPKNEAFRSAPSRRPLSPLPTLPRRAGAAAPLRSPHPAPLPAAHLAPPAPVQPVYRWKGHLIIDRYGAPLPCDRCFQCNAPTSRTIKRKYPHETLSLLSLRVVPMFLGLIVPPHDSAVVTFGQCLKCRKRRRTTLALLSVLLVTSFLLCLKALAATTGFLLALALGGFAAALVLCLWLGPFVQPTLVNGRWIHLRGGGREFLETIPESDLPQF